MFSGSFEHSGFGTVEENISEFGGRFIFGDHRRRGVAGWPVSRFYDFAGVVVFGEIGVRVVNWC